MNFPIPWKIHRIFPLVSLSGAREKVQYVLVSETLRSLVMSSEFPHPPSSHGGCEEGPKAVGSHGCSFKAITTIVHLVETHGELSLQDLHLEGGVPCGLGTGKPGSRLAECH